MTDMPHRHQQAFTDQPSAVGRGLSKEVPASPGKSLPLSTPPKMRTWGLALMPKSTPPVRYFPKESSDAVPGALPASITRQGSLRGSKGEERDRVLLLPTQWEYTKC